MDYTLRPIKQKENPKNHVVINMIHEHGDADFVTDSSWSFDCQGAEPETFAKLVSFITDYYSSFDTETGECYGIDDAEYVLSGSRVTVTIDGRDFSFDLEYDNKYIDDYCNSYINDVRYFDSNGSEYILEI